MECERDNEVDRAKWVSGFVPIVFALSSFQAPQIAEREALHSISVGIISWARYISASLSDPK